MSGYGYGEHPPTKDCPYCRAVCDADFVDIGIGFTQCGPYYCGNCHASEIGMYDEPRELTDEEDKTGWYRPESEPGSSANVIGGRVVSHQVMRDEYRKEFVGNPLWCDKSYVEDWFSKKRTTG